MDVNRGIESPPLVSGMTPYTVVTIFTTLIALAIYKRHRFVQRVNKAAG